MSIVTLKLEAKQIAKTLGKDGVDYKNIECIVFRALKLRHKEISKVDAMPYIKEVLGV